MRPQAIFPVLSLLALTLVGCGSDNTAETTTPPTDPAAPAAAPANAPAAQGDAKAEPFQEPMVRESKGGARGSTLISATNPQERARQVSNRNRTANQTNNNDPFGLLPTQAVASIREGELTNLGGGSKVSGVGGAPLPPTTAQEGENLPDLPLPLIPNITAMPLIPPLSRSPGGASGRSPSSPASPLGSPASSPVSSPVSSPSRAPSSGGSPSPSAASPSAGAPTPTSTPRPYQPPKPSTELAQSIELLGIVQVGTEIQLLVRTPDSPFGRYVSVGETVANGQVLIRRVERMQGGGEPTVILVQNGIEVSRSVGDNPPPTETTASGGVSGSSGTRTGFLPTRSSSDTIASRNPLPPVPVPARP